MLKKICSLCIAIVALLAMLSCGRGRLALLVTRAAERERNTAGNARASASGYALTEIKDFLENAARLDWSPQGDWIAYDKREMDGYSDVYRIRPDGTDNECLTCNHPDLPNKNTGNPTFTRTAAGCSFRPRSRITTGPRQPALDEGPIMTCT